MSRGTWSRHRARRTPRAPYLTVRHARRRPGARRGRSRGPTGPSRAAGRRTHDLQCHQRAVSRPRPAEEDVAASSAARTRSATSTTPARVAGPGRDTARRARRTPRRSRSSSAARRWSWCRVVREAQLGVARVGHEDRTADAPRRGERGLDDVVGGRESRCGVSHRPASARALITLTLRTSADGAPWLTEATWPGWPFPQLKAPHSR